MEESRVRYSKLSMMTATKRFSICGDPGGREGVGESKTHANTHTRKPRKRGRERGKMGKGRQRMKRWGGQGGETHTHRRSPRDRCRDGGGTERQRPTVMDRDRVGERGGERLREMGANPKGPS